MRKSATTVLILCSTTALAIGWHRREPSADYSAGVNDGLTMAMVCMIDARNKHEVVNWMTVERRAAKRLHVVRLEPWLGGER